MVRVESRCNQQKRERADVRMIFSFMLSVAGVQNLLKSSERKQMMGIGGKCHFQSSCTLVKAEENIIMVITGLRNISSVKLRPRWILRSNRRAGSGSQPGFISLAINRLCLFLVSLCLPFPSLIYNYNMD